MTIDSADGAISAAQKPGIVLATISTSYVGAIPARTEPTVRIIKPVIKILLPHKISDNFPPSSNRVSKVITYALKIHCNSV